jgi:outer membrane lipoprotein-sorting protein
MGKGSKGSGVQGFERPVPPGIARYGIVRWARTAAVVAAAFLTVGWGATWDEIKSAAAPIKAVSAGFVQEKHMKLLARPLVSSGVFYFKAPGFLRWEYRAPLRNVLLMTPDGTERWVGTDGGFVREAGPNLQAMQVVLEHISGWLEGRFDENPMFAASLGPGPTITLAPKDKAVARMIERIELVFSDRPGVISAVVIHEGEGSFTRLVFNDVVLNPAIDDAVFRKAA